MNVRVIATVALLPFLPVSIAAQTPPLRLDLTRLSHPSPAVTPTPVPFTLPVPTVRQNQFAKPPVRSRPCDDSATMGRADGGEKPFGKWFLAGLGGGFVTSWASFIWVPGLAHHRTRAPKILPDDVDTACYTAGFLKTAKRNSAWIAALGSGIGAAILQSLFIGWD